MMLEKSSVETGLNNSGNLENIFSTNTANQCNAETHNKMNNFFIILTLTLCEAVQTHIYANQQL